MLAHLARRGVRSITATVEAGNARSVALLERLRFRDASAERPAARAAGERMYVLLVQGEASDNRG